MKVKYQKLFEDGQDFDSTKPPNLILQNFKSHIYYYLTPFVMLNKI